MRTPLSLLGITLGLATTPLLLLSLGCCNTRTITQAGLVPFSEPDPPPSSHGAGDVYASGSGLTHLDATGTASSGDYVPAGQIHVGGMLRPLAGLMIRPMGMLAFADGAGSIGTGSAPTPGATVLTPLTPPHTTTFGLGVDFGYMLGDEDRIYVLHPHIGVHALGISASVSDPAGARAQDRIGAMAVISGGLDVGVWATPWLMLMASADVRNMPMLPSSASACSGSEPPFIDFGTVTLTMGVSAEVEVEPGFGMFAGVAFPAVGSTYAAYPIVSGGFRGSFGEGRYGMRGPPRAR